MPFSGADLERGMGSLVNHCATQYSAFSWDKEEQKLMDTLLSKCEDAGLTCSRVYFVRSRIGFRALSKMLFYTLSGLPSHRSRQTTMALQACFAAVCFASLGCRVGDLSLSKGYSGEECLQYKDISVVVNAQYGYLTDIQRHVSIDVTLRAEKGHKRDSSKRVIRIGLLPLTPHVDFITHLLVHAARHGAIAPDLSVNAVLQPR
ncbi:hypothetical protein BCR37DRAFT_379805 [Protomyces lactucae-debilis]|uniref:Uncharacterized protein n=1 Tax=Protomyces lactucae-debilis TaxID=2754530 RepID=A0A1Y2FDB4_PROLT|nr:uncharacterized protein BCR37DRAFT_379805 [Protomyces lactucae-debilis]ORY81909.1 hypothetical protein BCR37DRAFT_379805 [Protomyces lactucae-debilis]